MSIRLRQFIIVVLVLLLGACAETPIIEPSTDPQAEASWQSRAERLRQIQGYGLKGRLGIKTEKEGWTATLHWAQKEQLYKMRIIAPLGQGTFEVTGGHGKVLLRTEKNEVFEAANPNELMQVNLGWSVPVLGMQYWVLGLPSPGQAIEQRDIDANGRLVRLLQAGWDITISSYVRVKEYELPEKLTMENDQIRVKLVIKDWTRVL